MSNTRRSFINKLGLLAGATSLGKLIIPEIEENIFQLNNKYLNFSPAELAQEEDFWHQIKLAYTVSPQILNLNNGGVSPQPKVVQEAVELYNRLSNQAPSLYMWRTLDSGREPLRAALAKLANCSPEEIAINRNSSEALETVIFGLPLVKGDEVVLSKQDYPNMINAWKQRELRDGIVLRWLDFNFPIDDDDFMVRAYVNAMNDKTKLVHVTHIINWMGQILPAKKIAQAAHERGIEVLLDAAHSFAHIQYSIPEMACDYFGTSLHKWLCAPFGSGMLYIKKEKISKIFPLFAPPEPLSDDIRKFEHLGTRSFAIEQAIGQAISFHNMIGSERKEARLHFLKNYWAEKVLEIPGVEIGTSLNPTYACALALLKIKDHPPSEISQELMNTYKIHTVAIEWENISGVRITPNVYTLKPDLDRLISAITEISKT